MGRCLKWLDGCRRRAGKPARMASVARAGARKSGPRVEEVAAGGAPGGVAVCLCFPAIREISRGVVTMRLSALRLPLERGGKLKAQLACDASTKTRGCLTFESKFARAPGIERQADSRTSAGAFRQTPRCLP